MAIIYWFEPDEIVPFVATVPVDEDFWPSDLQPLPPQINNIQIWMDDGSFTNTQFDEDFWQNPVVPVVAALQFPQPFVLDGDSMPAGFLEQLPPDEDFWVNAVKPVYQSFIVPNYALFEDQVPAGNLLAEMDEDFWANPVAPVIAALYQSLPYGIETSAEFVPQATAGAAGNAAYQVYGTQGLQPSGV